MIGEIWDLIALQPVINVLIVLTNYLLSSFGVAIIALTIAVNVLMYPLTRKQLHTTQAMQSLQPKLSELQKKHAKDRQKLAQEQMKLYKESGMSPTGCLVPMLAQMPIWIALYQSIIRLLAMTPEGFLGLSQYLYSWPLVYSMLPLGSEFLWLNLAESDVFLAVVVGGAMWLQQKMATPTTTDLRQQSMSRMMQWMMPFMFGFICLSVPSGLALFWAASTVIRIVIQYYMTGWGGLAKVVTPRTTGRDKGYKKRIIAVEEVSSEHADIGADIVETGSEQEEGLDNGESGYKRQDRGGGDPTRLRATRRQPGRGKGHHRKRR
ncbi:YidC/Oxa1 family membrane protein insertase [Chloroflexota bacterium]